jgi:hypothetical protein
MKLSETLINEILKTATASLEQQIADLGIKKIKQITPTTLAITFNKKIPIEKFKHLKHVKNIKISWPLNRFYLSLEFDSEEETNNFKKILVKA